MGKISEFFDYIKAKIFFNEEKQFYSKLTINDQIKRARKEYLKRKRGTK